MLFRDLIWILRAFFFFVLNNVRNFVFISFSLATDRLLQFAGDFLLSDSGDLFFFAQSYFVFRGGQLLFDRKWNDSEL